MRKKFNYKKLLCGFISLLLLIVTFIVGGCSTSNRKILESEINEVVSSGTEGSANSIITNIKSNGISLARSVIPREAYAENEISTQAESAITVTATITPANADNQNVDWSISWKNANSSWAKNKSVTDYLILTPTSDGALTATVECLQAFGAPAVIEVVSRDNSEISATCQCDYVKGIKSQDGSYIVGLDDLGRDDFALWVILASSSEYKAYSNLLWGTGTITPSVEFKVWFELSEPFLALVQEALPTLDVSSYICKYEMPLTVSNMSSGITAGYTFTTPANFMENFINAEMAGDNYSTILDALNTVGKSAYNSYPNYKALCMKGSVVAKYAGVECWSDEYNNGPEITVNYMLIKTAVNDVNVDSGIAFFPNGEAVKN